MKITKFIPLAMLSVVLLASCQSRESKINKLVTSHLEQSLENPQNLKVLEIAEPDSAFGLNYFYKAGTGLYARHRHERHQGSDGAHGVHDQA